MCAYYLWINTFLGSVFMLLGIFMLYDKAGSMNYQILGCFKQKIFQYRVFLVVFLNYQFRD